MEHQSQINVIIVGHIGVKTTCAPLAESLLARIQQLKQEHPGARVLTVEQALAEGIHGVNEFKITPRMEELFIPEVRTLKNITRYPDHKEQRYRSRRHNY